MQKGGVDMRTTLSIPDSVLKRAKAYARHHNKKLSELFSESVEERLAREERMKGANQQTFRVTPKAMGKPVTDIADRDALYGEMEEQ